MSSNSTDTRDIQKFGITAFIFFACLCIFGTWLNKPLPAYVFGFLSVLGFGLILLPSRMRPVYTYWEKIGHFLGRVLSILILILAYYLVITPTALVKRFIGGRPLAIEPDKKASSYWVKRTEKAQPRQRFLKRY